MLVITVCAPVVKMSHSVFWCMSNVSTRRVDLCSKGALESAGGLNRKQMSGLLSPRAPGFNFIDLEKEYSSSQQPRSHILQLCCTLGDSCHFPDPQPPHL